MADRCLVSLLQLLAFVKPHQGLVEYDIFEEGDAESIKLIRFVYASTSGWADGKQVYGGIRDLVAAFAACKKKARIKEQGFVELLREGGDCVNLRMLLSLPLAT